MSVIGISPSDIVGGVRVVNKAVGALKSDTGAQAQYEESKRSRDELHAVAKALSEACSSLDVPSAPSLGQSFNQLLKTHELQQKDLQKYEGALGQGSSSKKRRAIPLKLCWVFHKDKELRDSDARTRPAVDAAILRSLQLQNDIEHRDHAAIKNHVSTTTDSVVARIEQGIGSLGDNVRDLADEIVTENQQHMQELMAVLRSMSQAQERNITKVLHQMLKFPVSSRAGPKRNYYHLGPRKRASGNKAQGSRIRSGSSQFSLPGSFPTDELGSRSSWSSTTNASLSHLRNGSSHYLVDTTRAFWAMLLTGLYANPHSRQFAIRLWARARADPVLAFLCLMCIALVQRCLLHVPMHISLLSDNSIAFEDVFGIELRVPYQQCEQFEFFHGFLEYCFRHRPGLQRVLQRRYQLFLGNSHGQAIERSTWTKVVKPRTRLTMAMLLLSAQSQCAKCFGELEPSDKGQIRICFTCDQEYSVETLTIQHQKSSSTSVFGHHVTELDGLDLPPRNPIESHEVEGVASQPDKAKTITPPLRSSKAVETEANAAIPTERRDTIIEQNAIESPSRSSSVAKQKHEALLELELQLFKNMTIRIVPQATPLRPMLRRGEAMHDDNLSTSVHASEALSEAWAEGIGEEAASSSLLGLKEVDFKPNPSSSQDDMSIEKEPTRYVDYLSHEWDEREAVLAWRYVTRRKDTIEHAPRLENTAWRCWTQRRHCLKKLDPASLNWEKDSDVTWLYGPHLSNCRDYEDDGGNSPSTFISFSGEKSILKRKSASAAILERSRSQRSLLQRAGDIIKVQQEASSLRRPNRSTSSTPISTAPRSCRISPTRSPPEHYSTTPPDWVDVKHVLFSDEVQQAQAVDIAEDEEGLTGDDYGFDVEDDEGRGLNMTPAPPHKEAYRQTLPSTISTLPNTTLRSPSAKAGIDCLIDYSKKIQTETPKVLTSHSHFEV